MAKAPPRKTKQPAIVSAVEPVVPPAKALPSVLPTAGAKKTSAVPQVKKNIAALSVPPGKLQAVPATVARLGKTVVAPARALPVTSPGTTQMSRKRVTSAKQPAAARKATAKAPSATAPKAPSTTQPPAPKAKTVETSADVSQFAMVAEQALQQVSEAFRLQAEAWNALVKTWLDLMGNRRG